MRNILCFLAGGLIATGLLFSYIGSSKTDVSTIKDLEINGPEISYIDIDIPVQHYGLNDDFFEKFKKAGRLEYGVPSSSILVPVPVPDEPDEPDIPNSGNTPLIGLGEPIHPLPAGTYRITSPFGIRVISELYDGDPHFHAGVDFAAPIGTPIKATLDGVVEKAGYQGAGGKVLLLRHNDDVTSLYAHLDEFRVSEGDTVEQGDKIAMVGNSGTKTTGPHLHFELHFEGMPIDPLLYLGVDQDEK